MSVNTFSKWTEIDLSPKRSGCERSNANWDWSKIDPTAIDLSVNGHYGIVIKTETATGTTYLNLR